MSTRAACSQCRGKGHVLDGGFALAACLSVVLIPCLLFDRDDANGVTRRECPRCAGRGWVRTGEYW